MAGEIPDTFTTQSQVLANYDYVDLSSGLGYVTYYGFADSVNGVATAYYLGGSTNLYSNTVSISTATSSTTNFDSSPFKLPKIVSGKAYINFVVRNTVASTTNCRFKAQLFKVTSGGSATSLGSQVIYYHDGTLGTSAMTATTNEEFLAVVSLTETKINPTESLRLTVILEDDDSETILAFCDPTGLAAVGTTQSSKMTVQIPFKIFS